MSTNAMKKCTVGAMLAGGSLLATQTALGEGTVTWNNSQAWSELVSNGMDPTPNYDFVQGGTLGVVGTGTSSITNASFDYTNSATGFSMSNGSVVEGWLAAGREFTISGLGVGQGVSVSAMMNLVGVAGQISFMREVTPGYWGSAFYLNGDLAFAAEDGPLTTAGLLGNGTYQIGLMAGSADEPYSTYAASGTFASFTVPAPGALALLGAAGLVGSRRRR